MDCRPDTSFSSRDLLAVAVLVLLTTLFWWHEIALPFAKQDERVYLEAASMVTQGRSPYEAGGYFYTPAFAELGSRAVGLVGELGYLRMLRLATVVGACLAVWYASLWTGWGWALRGLVGLAVLTLSETVEVGLTAGNVSAAAIGTAILALMCYRRHPWLAALVLGLGIAFKPVAIVVPPMLILDAWLRRDASGWKTALATPGVLGLALLPGIEHLAELPGAIAGGAAFHPRNLALSRVLYCFGLEIPPVVLFALVLLATVGVIIWRRSQLVELRALLIVASLLALPIVWIYSMLLALPLQLEALAAMSTRRLGAGGLRSRINWLPILAVSSIFLSHAAGGVESWPLYLQGLVMAVPVLSPAFLWIYCHLLPASFRGRRLQASRPGRSDPRSWSGLFERARQADLAPDLG